MLAFFFLKFHFEGFWHLAPMVVFGWPAAWQWKQYTTKKHGIKGENRAFDELAKLSERYHVFNNVQLHCEGRSREIDILVVGTNGVFVVEVKNHNGFISGDIAEHQWTQHKTGRKGGEYSKDMRNPVMQVKGQVYSLAKNLQTAGYQAWVEGIVYFSNPEVTLSIRGENYKVTDSVDYLIRFIEQYNPRRELSYGTVEQITTYLISKQAS